MTAEPGHVAWWQAVRRGRVARHEPDQRGSRRLRGAVRPRRIGIADEGELHHGRGLGERRRQLAVAVGDQRDHPIDVLGQERKPIVAQLGDHEDGRMLEQRFVELAQRLLGRIVGGDRAHRLRARRRGRGLDLLDRARERGAGDQRDGLSPAPAPRLELRADRQPAAQDAGQVREHAGRLGDQLAEVVLAQLERRAGERSPDRGGLRLAGDERHHADHVSLPQLGDEPALGEHGARSQLRLLGERDERVGEPLDHDVHAGAGFPLVADDLAGGELAESHRGRRCHQLTGVQALEQRNALQRRARHGHALERRERRHQAASRTISIRYGSLWIAGGSSSLQPAAAPISVMRKTERGAR